MSEMQNHIGEARSGNVSSCNLSGGVIAKNANTTNSGRGYSVGYNHLYFKQKTTGNNIGSGKARKQMNINIVLT